MKSFQNDLKKGKEDELLVLPKIQKFFNRDIIKVKDEYSRYDFQDNIYKYELKSRNNNYNKFPTTIIPSDKIIDKNLILLFNFYDGLTILNIMIGIFQILDVIFFVERNV